MKKKIYKYRWIAQDRNGTFGAYTHKPTLCAVNWSIDLSDRNKDYIELISGKDLGFIDETPPNWQKSLRRYWGLGGIIIRLWIAFIKYYNL
jgi:hypothetical protein